MAPSELPTFRRLPSAIEHVEIRDKDGTLLAYCIRIPNPLVQRLLPETDTHCQRKIDPQGGFPIRHYATWVDNSLDIFYS